MKLIFDYPFSNVNGEIGGTIVEIFLIVLIIIIELNLINALESHARDDFSWRQIKTCYNHCVEFPYIKKKFKL